jgi:hypothetical protein
VPPACSPLPPAQVLLWARRPGRKLGAPISCVSLDGDASLDDDVSKVVHVVCVSSCVRIWCSNFLLALE